jgi:hypothetical protein
MIEISTPTQVRVGAAPMLQQVGETVGVVVEDGAVPVPEAPSLRRQSRIRFCVTTGARTATFPGSPQALIGYAARGRVT